MALLHFRFSLSRVWELLLLFFLQRYTFWRIEEKTWFFFENILNHKELTTGQMVLFFQLMWSFFVRYQSACSSCLSIWSIIADLITTICLSIRTTRLTLRLCELFLIKSRNRIDFSAIPFDRARPRSECFSSERHLKTGKRWNGHSESISPER